MADRMEKLTKSWHIRDIKQFLNRQKDIVDGKTPSNPQNTSRRSKTSEKSSASSHNAEPDTPTQESSDACSSHSPLNQCRAPAMQEPLKQDHTSSKSAQDLPNTLKSIKKHQETSPFQKFWAPRKA